MLQKQEFPTNTEEQVRQYLSQTFAILDEYEIDSERWPVVFAKVADWVAAKQVAMVEIGMPNMTIPGKRR